MGMEKPPMIYSCDGSSSQRLKHTPFQVGVNTAHRVGRDLRDQYELFHLMIHRQ